MSLGLHLANGLTSGLSSLADAGELPPASEEEYYSSWSLFLVCILLLLSLLTSYHLQHNRIRLLMVHETLVSIGAGTLVGLVIRLFGEGSGRGMIREMLVFRHTIFFNLLLPPIILNSGYSLHQRQFFINFFTILTFAFLGTFISALGVGVLTFLYSSLGIDTPALGLVECLIFGSTLSATDPVTILAIFDQYKVDPKLYTIIFGESLLNDAVSIVMYDTLSQFHGTEVFISSIFHGIGLFLLSFSISMFLGVSFGLSTSLLLKHTQLEEYPDIETAVVALSAYTCYFFSNGIGKSGIVSLLFCGITLKHYAYHTMSRRTQRSTRYIFATLAKLSEGFIFVYLGLSLFTSTPSSTPTAGSPSAPSASASLLSSLYPLSPQTTPFSPLSTLASPSPPSTGPFTYFKPLFILITVIVVSFTRYAAVFPLSSLINWAHGVGWRRRVRRELRENSLAGRETRDAVIQREPPEELPPAYQTLLFWAGLRGAVGVALAAGFKGPNAQMLRTTVLIVVVLTILIFGGTTGRMLAVAGVKMGVEEERSDEDSDEGGFVGGVRDGGGVRRRRSSGSGRRSVGRIGMHYPVSAGLGAGGRVSSREYNHHHQNQNQGATQLQTRNQNQNPRGQGQGHTLFSASSSDSYDFDDYDSDVGEVLPLGPTGYGGGGAAGGQGTAGSKAGQRPTSLNLGLDPLGVNSGGGAGAGAGARQVVDHLSASLPASPTTHAHQHASLDPNSHSTSNAHHNPTGSTSRLASLGLPSMHLPTMSMPHLPNLSNLPHIPAIPSIPSIPSMSSIPGLGDLKDLQMEDGRWFQTLDERYLLPIFSNATARRSSRRARGAGGGVGRGGGRGDGEDGDGARQWEGGEGEGEEASSEDEIDLSMDRERERHVHVHAHAQSNDRRANRHSMPHPSALARAHSYGGGGGASGTGTGTGAGVGVGMALGSLGRRSPEENSYRTERGLPSPVLRSASGFGQGGAGGEV